MRSIYGDHALNLRRPCAQFRRYSRTDCGWLGFDEHSDLLLWHAVDEPDVDRQRPPAVALEARVGIDLDELCATSSFD
eukprot:COSAG06_NODE_1228_length_10179_cov_3.735119_20_plen_78_part_00